MMNYVVEDKVKAVVLDWVAERKMFTAYDVTRYVRASLKDTVPHDEVNALISNLFWHSALDGYDRNGRFLSRAGAWARVYHPKKTNVMDYAEGWLVVDTTRTFGDCVDGEYMATLDNRLNIGPELLEHIGVNKGDLVGVQKDGDELKLVRCDLSNYYPDHFDNLLRVDQCRRIRLGKRTLNALNRCSKFKVEKTDGCLIVKGA